MIIHHSLPYSHLQHNTFSLCCCILVLLLYYSVVTHVYILLCTRLLIIQAQSYKAYRYFGDPASNGRSHTCPRPSRISPDVPTARLRLRGVNQAPALLASRSAGVVRAGGGAVLQPAACFDYVVAALAPELATEVWDLLLTHHYTHTHISHTHTHTHTHNHHHHIQETTHNKQGPSLSDRTGRT